MIHSLRLYLPILTIPVLAFSVFALSIVIAVRQHTILIGTSKPSPIPSAQQPVATPESSARPSFFSALLHADAPSASPTPTPTPTPLPKGVKRTIATLFWIGEPADESNAFIPNDVSAWDTGWQRRYGGVDEPYTRCGHWPCGFTPKENPFYYALPYNDLDAKGLRKDSAEDIPWFEENKDKKSVVKNAWVKVTKDGKTCYGQWEDVGPLSTDDVAFVFGDAQTPQNTFGAHAGIDLSPAMWHCLGMTTNEPVIWQFVTPEAVPTGPWKEIVTTSNVQW